MSASATVPTPASRTALPSPLLAWFFVFVWGSGYIATKAGLHYAPPLTFLSLRFAFGVLLLAPLLLVAHRISPLRWPATRAELGHVVVAGLLMHAINLGGSHCAQYLGLSAGITALVLAAQPLVTAVIVSAWGHERLGTRRWTGVLLGLFGVALVVWHRVDTAAASWGAIASVLVSLTAITIGTLYQRHYLPTVDLRTSTWIQFIVSLAVLAPTAKLVEGFRYDFAWQMAAAIAYLVIFASILAVSALHTLMRRGQATRVTSLLYLTPLIAVALEWLLFAVQPSALTQLGVVVTCAGVALATRAPSARASAAASAPASAPTAATATAGRAKP